MDEGNSFNPLKNVVLNLQATGLAAIVCVWLVCITLVALFAPENSNTQSVLVVLTVFGGAIASSIALARLK